MRLTALRGNASFSFDPVVTTWHGSAAPGNAAARTVRYNCNARPKQSKPAPRFDVDPGTFTSTIMLATDYTDNTFAIASRVAETRIGVLPKLPAICDPSGAINVW